MEQNAYPVTLVHNYHFNTNSKNVARLISITEGKFIHTFHVSLKHRFSMKHEMICRKKANINLLSVIVRSGCLNGKEKK